MAQGKAADLRLIELAKILYFQNCPVQQIASEIGLNVQTVYNYIRKFGWSAQKQQNRESQKQVLSKLNNDNTLQSTIKQSIETKQNSMQRQYRVVDPQFISLSTIFEFSDIIERTSLKIAKIVELWLEEISQSQAKDYTALLNCARVLNLVAQNQKITMPDLPEAVHQKILIDAGIVDFKESPAKPFDFGLEVRRVE